MKNKPSNLAIMGAGGHARVVADAALAAGTFGAIWFYDDDPNAPSEWCGLPLRGTIQEVLDGKVKGLHGGLTVIGIGSNAIRARLSEFWHLAGGVLANVVHPAAVIARSVRLGEGTVVFAGAVLNVDVHTGHSVIVNTNASVDHNCRLGNCVHVSPGATLAGDVSVGDRSWIGIGAVVREGIRIGSDVVVGAGAAVVSDVPDGAVVTGVPARPSCRPESRLGEQRQ